MNEPRKYSVYIYILQYVLATKTKYNPLICNSLENIGIVLVEVKIQKNSYLMVSQLKSVDLNEE